MWKSFHAGWMQGLAFLGAGVLSVTGLLWPLLIAPGLPAYQHDWSWPLSFVALDRGMLAHFSLWDWAGLGSANPGASANPLLFLFWGCGHVVNTSIGARLVLLLATFGAYCSAALFAWSLRRDLIGAIAAGMVYAVSPVVANKICAGHLAYVLCYALLPLIAWSAREYVRGRGLALPMLLLLIMLDTLQPQFVVLGPLTAIIMYAFVYRWPPRPTIREGLNFVGPLVLVPLVAAIAFAPTLLALENARSQWSALYPLPLQSWERQMSVSVIDAIGLLHYTPFYMEQILGVWPAWLFFAVPLCAACGLVAGWRHDRRTAFGLLVVFGLGLAGIAGLQGPLGPLLGWSFLHVRAASIFREVYNAAVLVAFVYSAALALSVAEIRGRRFKILVLAGVVSCEFPLWSGGLQRALPLHDLHPPNLATIADGRVVAFPLLTPIAFEGARIGGVDITAPLDAHHQNLSEYPARQPLDIVALQRFDRPWYRYFLEELGVVEILPRRELVSVDAQRLRLSTDARLRQQSLAGAPLVSFEKQLTPAPATMQQLAPHAVAVTGEIGLLPQTPGAPAVVALDQSRENNDPQRAWVAADLWHLRSADPASWPVNGGIYTESALTQHIVLPHRFAEIGILYNARQAVTGRFGGRRFLLPATVNTRWVVVKGSGLELAIEAPRAGMALYRVAAGHMNIPTGHYAQPVVRNLSRPYPWSVRVQMNALHKTQALLVFRERYDRRWMVKGAKVLWHGMPLVLLMCGSCNRKQA